MGALCAESAFPLTLLNQNPESLTLLTQVILQMVIWSNSNPKPGTKCWGRITGPVADGNLEQF